MPGKLRLRSLILSAALLSGACAHGAPQAEGTTAATSYAAESKEVDYSDGTTTLKGFIAYPKAEGPRPAVIVVHEWWGLNDYVRKRAQQLADLGYVALAVDMYGDGKTAEHPGDAQKFMMEVMQNLDVGVKRFDAALTLLQNDQRVDSTKIGAMGYCFGGAVSLHMARLGKDLDFVASFHGNLASQHKMEPGVFKGKILVETGAADPFVPPEQVTAFRAEMDAAKADYTLDEYAGAKHAFTSPGADELGQKFNLPLAYDAAADQASWAKLLELLDTVWAKPSA